MKPALVARFQAALSGSYTIERELGRGGMATVFLAHDRSGAEVALKLLNPDLSSTMGAERFRRCPGRRSSTASRVGRASPGWRCASSAATRGRT